ncbi:MAG: hypothetical protein E7B43_09060 [Streptococcus sp.]|uniref:hypothetical protein n=1 Tax=Streptococcus sp. TaxID=1306 RepID=UPI00260042FA|nr:hypothetical protein [Streptococcus sp.]MBS6932250.1 hypothetical protein [Streptococcus sp.]MDU3070687.1 hypothetical protein [Streptococcus sp.]
MSKKTLQQLKSIRNKIKEKILEHDLFKMNRDEAIKYLISRSETANVISGYKISLDIQNSLYFILHNLDDNVPFTNKKLDVDELILLIKNINNYLDFERFIQLYNHGIVRPIISGKCIRFEYVNEQYRNNEIYNGYWHREELNKALSEYPIYQNEFQNITDKMFDLTVDINFGDFTIKDYKKFCKGIDKIIQNNYFKNIQIVSEIGYILLTKEKWIFEINKIIPELSSKKINQIIDFLTYDFEDIFSDPLLSYFIPIENQLILSFSIFLSVRLDKNMLRLLNKKNETIYQNEQKKLELHQINELKCMKSDLYDFDTDKNGSPGEDLIVYDKKANVVHAIELKYKLPVDSVNEIRNLKKLLSKAAKQNKDAKKNLTVDNVFEKYFDHKYYKIKPNKIVFFTLTNYSVDYFSNSFILLTQHYKQLLKEEECSKHLEEIFNDKYRGMNLVPRIKFKKINLIGNIIKIPINYAEVPNNN